MWTLLVDPLLHAFTNLFQGLRHGMRWAGMRHYSPGHPASVGQSSEYKLTSLETGKTKKAAAHKNASPVLERLHSGWQHLQHMCLEKHAAPSKEKKTCTVVSLRRFDRDFYYLKGSQEEDEKVPSEHVKIMFFPYSRTMLRAIRSDRPRRRAGRLPVGLDDLTHRHRELCEHMYTLLL